MDNDLGKMDKINVTDWSETLSKAEHKKIYESDRYSEHVLTFGEEKITKGKISQIKTPNITLKQLTIHTEHELVLRDDEEVESIESLFVLNGAVKSFFPETGNKLDFHNKLHGFQYNPKLISDHKVNPGAFKIIHLTYEMDFFKNMAGNSNEKLLEKIANNIEKKQSFQLASATFILNPRMFHLLEEISSSKFQGPARYLFAESKMMELLALQMEDMLKKNSSSTDHKISDSDREKLKAVKDYIENHYLEPLSLNQITRMFSLNEFKLKKGFKLLFSTTVFGLVLQLRMDHAFQLLNSKKMNVSEAAFLIGYQNVGSFSYEFKKKFGFSPREIA